MSKCPVILHSALRIFGILVGNGWGMGGVIARDLFGGQAVPLRRVHDLQNVTFKIVYISAMQQQ